MRRLFFIVLCLFVGGSAASKELGKFIHVSPAGTYLAPGPGDSPAPATRIYPAKLGFKAADEDYIGLGEAGAFDADGPGTNYSDTINSQVAIFKGTAGFLYPAYFSQWRPEQTLVGDIPQDFNTCCASPPIVRVPIGATTVLLGPDDEYYADNTDPNGDYGVRVLYPNSQPPGSGGSCSRTAESETSAQLSPADFRRLLAALPTAKELPVSPPAKKYLPGVSSGTINVTSWPPMRYPQLRGWYCVGATVNTTNAIWDPQQSLFNGRGGGHTGVDIFAPQHTVLRAPVDGIVRWNPAGILPGGFGNIVTITFKTTTGEVYNVLYGHVEALVGANNRRVKLGDIIAVAGCAGNASKALCGQWLPPMGHRTDHVHVGLFPGKLEGPLKGRWIDPIANLGWTVKYAQ